MSARYKVIKKSFIAGKLHGPGTKRLFVTYDKPLKKVPANLEQVGKETAAQRKKREAAEKANAEQVERDQKDVTDLSFMGDGEKAPETNAVETL